MKKMVLIINPGSTSTKVALFNKKGKIAEKTIRHTKEEISSFEKIADQKNFRKHVILEFLEENHTSIKNLTAVVGRGGLLRPITGGTYLVDDDMLEDLTLERNGSHASNLGAILADDLAQEAGVTAYIVDPVVVDEMRPLAKISGLKGIERRSVAHVLNQKAVARKVLAGQGKDYQTSSVLVAHMGGGISIGAHQNGQIIDLVNGLDGEGPFSPERTGELPLMQFAEKIIQEKLTLDEVKKTVAGNGGLKSYIGEIDLRIVEETGNAEAKCYVKAMGYQTAKAIGSMAAALKGEVDGIILTGGASHSKTLIQVITDSVSWIAPVEVVPGEMEMQALYEGVMRVLDGKESPKIYSQKEKVG